MNPETMTLEIAIEELRSIARALDIDLPSDAGYVERLHTVADFLQEYGNVLSEGLADIRKSIERL